MAANLSRPGCRGLRPGKGETAFTLVEALAAIAVISLFALAGLSVLGSAGEKAGLLIARISKAHGLLLLDRELDADLARVRLPYWSSGSDLRVSKEAAALPYVDGENDAVLELRVEGAYLDIGMPGRSLRLGPFGALELGLLKDKEGGPIGISLSLGEGGKDGVVAGLFSSVPLIVGAQ